VGLWGYGLGWDCCRCRLDGPNGLLLHCRDSIKKKKIMRGTDRVDKEQLSLLVEGSVMRGHRFKVRGRRFTGDVRIFF